MRPPLQTGERAWGLGDVARGFGSGAPVPQAPHRICPQCMLPDGLCDRCHWLPTHLRTSIAFFFERLLQHFCIVSARIHVMEVVASTIFSRCISHFQEFGCLCVEAEPAYWRLVVA